MRRLVLAVSAIACMSAPAFAQGAPDDAASHARHEMRHAVQECMKNRLSDLREAVHAHMHQFRAANPGATHEALHAERRSFGERIRADHAEEIHAAHAACRSTMASASTPAP